MNRTLPFTPAEALRSVTRKSRPGALLQAAVGALALHGAVVALLWAAPIAPPAASDTPPAALRMALAPKASEPQASPEPPPTTTAPAAAPVPEHGSLRERQHRRKATKAAHTTAHPTATATTDADAREVDKGGLLAASAAAQAGAVPIDFGATVTLGDAAPGGAGAPGGIGSAGAGATPPMAAPDAFRCDWPSGLYARDTAIVEAYAQVDADGRVRHVTVEHAPTPAFRRAAERCVHTVRFQPARDATGRPQAARSPLVRLRFVREG